MCSYINKCVYVTLQRTRRRDEKNGNHNRRKPANNNKLELLQTSAFGQRTRAKMRQRTRMGWAFTAYSPPTEAARMLIEKAPHEDVYVLTRKTC